MRLEVLLAQKDMIAAQQAAEIASLRGEIAVARLRAHEGASAEASFDARAMAFTEPNPAAKEGV